MTIPNLKLYLLGIAGILLHPPLHTCWGRRLNIGLHQDLKKYPEGISDMMFDLLHFGRTRRDKTHTKKHQK